MHKPSHKKNEHLLIAKMRSFLVMAETLNVSQAERLLGITRQTIRRHIRSLEEQRGHLLFEVTDRAYRLTTEGMKAIAAAEQLLIDAQSWCTGNVASEPKLSRYANYENSKKYTYLEQKGLGDVFISDTPFIKNCLTKWIGSSGQVDDLACLRAYAMLFRKDFDAWVLIEVGEKASVADWFGPSWRTSCLGTRVNNLPASDSLAPIANSAFETISLTQSARLDHICTQFPKIGARELVPVSYKRLILAVTFQDSTPALLNIVERTHDIRIEGLPDRLRTLMKPHLINAFSII